ncbi:MAG TPA: type II secretion system protein [Alphaproteobacteria bacterium]|nr:type II secretion system protein [Alphaproteobacteria bacterium]
MNIMKKWSAPLKNRQGFSMPEMLLVVAVMAILVTITTPGLLNFLRAKDVRQEETNQLAIRTAIANMIVATGDLPADTATGSAAWYNVLARYTNLSPGQIQNDVWKKPRSYVMLKNTQTMLGSPVNIFYVSIISRGPNAVAAAVSDSLGNTIVPVNGTDFAASTSTDWWKFNSTDPVAAFSALEAGTGSDDIMTRYTDYPEKISAYNTTLDRLGKITDALSNYASTKYAERVVACNVASPPADCTTAPPEKQIHYPYGTDGGTTTDAAGNYNATVLTATQTQNGTTSNYFYNGTDATLRRTGMTNLMRLLGLPDEFCCSALEQTNSLPTAFYYFSNPRARTGNPATPCATRYAISGSGSALPARITNVLVPDNGTNPTCG